MTRRWQDAPDPTESVQAGPDPRGGFTLHPPKPLRLAHPQAEFDILVRREDDEFCAWLSGSGVEVAVVGKGDSAGAAIRDAHMQLSILVAMLATELGR